MPFSIIRNDITNMTTDAIVNTANPHAAIGSGVDSAIHKKAGAKLLAARKQIGDIPVGQAAITRAYNLHAKYVIHVVGPLWQGGHGQEAALLRTCYENALQLAKKHGCTSLAFPLISTGTYGFPKDLALQIAMQTISSFLLQHEMMVYLVVFDKNSYALSEKIVQAVESYIDENYVLEHTEPKESSIAIQRRYMADAHPHPSASMSSEQYSMPTPASRPAGTKKRKLEDLINEMDESFAEALFRLIDAKDLTDPQVYKKANLDRKHFSKIRNNKHYQPTKITALALAIAMELNLDETRDFIGKAGFALTHSNKFDIIVEYFIVNENYNIFELNEVLFAFDQPLIGG